MLLSRFNSNKIFQIDIKSYDEPLVMSTSFVICLFLAKLLLNCLQCHISTIFANI